MKNVITLDWDIPFYDLFTHNRATMYRLLLLTAMSYGKVFVRKSPNGRTHVKIILRRELDFFERLEIRAIMMDDPARISNDLRRFARGDEVERLFDIKVDGFVARAGEWIPAEEVLDLPKD